MMGPGPGCIIMNPLHGEWSRVHARGQRFGGAAEGSAALGLGVYQKVLLLLLLLLVEHLRLSRESGAGRRESPRQGHGHSGSGNQKFRKQGCVSLRRGLRQGTRHPSRRHCHAPRGRGG